MAQPEDDITLTSRHYVTLILRLTLDQTGRLLQGELVDTTESLRTRFIGTTGLHQAVERWLAQQEQADRQQASS